MAEHQIKLTGWQGVAVGFGLVGVLGIRLATFNDAAGDSDLMQRLELALTTEFLPGQVESLRAVYEAGDIEATSRGVKSLAAGGIDIESVKTSYPLFDFTSDKDVIVKVTYFLNDSTGSNRGTSYYRFRHRHGALGNNWDYRYGSSALMYYLNFM